MENLLGEFIKARRARVRPEEVGVRNYGRRRVPGLRRDELASLAGLSEPYLTRLEQGVDRHPSVQVLESLAGALRLDPDAAAHLLALADPNPTRAPEPDLADDVQRLVDAWEAAPAYVRNRRFEVLAANKLALALADLYRPGRNLVRDLFLDPVNRRLFPDWAQIAQQSVAALRAEADPRDPRIVELLAELRADADFARMWALHDVRPVRDEIKRFDHPEVGRLELRRQALTIAGAEDQVIIVYQAAAQSPSAAALARLSAPGPDAGWSDR